MPPAHRNVEIATITARVIKGVIHACGCDGLTTSVAAGTGVRAFDLTGSARAVARERFRFASASLARSSSIVAAATMSGPIKSESAKSLISHPRPKIRESKKQSIASRFCVNPKIRESIAR